MKLSDFLGAKDEKKDENKKAILRVKLALLVKRVKGSKNPEVKSAFVDHLEKSGASEKGE
jgi:hypothetical protein